MQGCAKGSLARGARPGIGWSPSEYNSCLPVPILMFIDCHVHLDPFPDLEVPKILSRGMEAGVAAVISAGTTVKSSRRAVELASRHPGFFAGVGVHPMNLIRPLESGDYGELEALALSTDKVVVMSEIGLDFMEGAPDRSMQYPAFREQIRLGLALKLPIVFHSRESHPEVLRVLREERAYEVGGAMHYFQGDYETAREAIDLGFYVSLARPLLRLPELQTVVARLPLRAIVLETDAAPQPFKAKRENWTEPRHVRTVAEKLAALHEVSVDEVEAVTTRNALAMLGSHSSPVARHLGGTSPHGADPPKNSAKGEAV